MVRAVVQIKVVNKPSKLSLLAKYFYKDVVSHLLYSRYVFMYALKNGQGNTVKQPKKCLKKIATLINLNMQVSNFAPCLKSENQTYTYYF